MNILYIGPLVKGSCTSHRLFSMQRARSHWNIFTINTLDSHQQKMEAFFLNRVKSYIYRKDLFRIGRFLFSGREDYSSVNNNILDSIEENNIQMVWIDKGQIIEERVFKYLKKKKIMIIGYSPDDMMNKDNQSENFLKSLKYYHQFFTTKTFGVKELESLGCKKVNFIGNGFDNKIHTPQPTNSKNYSLFGGDIGFIGDYEHDRYEHIKFLAENMPNICIRVWGTNWDKAKNIKKYKNIKCEYKGLWDKDYATAISNFDINLCFLRKANRDLQTIRTVEIPACKGFMLAERTSEHKRLFKEDFEAAFFSSKEELLEKCKKYLANEKAREEIKLNGFKKCISNGYDNDSRMLQMLEIAKL